MNRMSVPAIAALLALSSFVTAGLAIAPTTPDAPAPLAWAAYMDADGHPLRFTLNRSVSVPDRDGRDIETIEIAINRAGALSYEFADAHGRLILTSRCFEVGCTQWFHDWRARGAPAALGALTPNAIAECHPCQPFEVTIEGPVRSFSYPTAPSVEHPLSVVAPNGDWPERIVTDLAEYTLQDAEGTPILPIATILPTLTPMTAQPYHAGIPPEGDVPDGIDSYNDAFEATSPPAGRVTDIEYVPSESWSSVGETRLQEGRTTTITVTTTQATWEYERQRITSPISLDLIGWVQTRSGGVGTPCEAERIVPVMDAVSQLRTTLLSDAFSGYSLIGAPHCVTIASGNVIEAARVEWLVPFETAVAESATGWFDYVNLAERIIR